MTAVVGVTVQDTVGVRAQVTIDPSVVSAQIDAVAGDIGVDAVKVGTTWSHATMEAIAQSLCDLHVPLVVDPVMVTASNAVLANPAEVAASARSILLPLATVATPNLREARWLTGRRDLDSRALAEGVVAAGARAVVITGGAVDVRGDLYFDGDEYCEIPVDWHEGGAVHGSGCAHSAALAAFLGLGESLQDAARLAARLAAQGVARGSALALGHGIHPVDVIGLEAIDEARR